MPEIEQEESFNACLDEVVGRFADTTHTFTATGDVCRALCDLLVEDAGYRDAWVVRVPADGAPAHALASQGLEERDTEAALNAINSDPVMRSAWVEALRASGPLVRRASVEHDRGVSHTANGKGVAVLRLDFSWPPETGLVVGAQSPALLGAEAIRSLDQIASDAAMALDRIAGDQRISDVYRERDSARETLDALVDASPAGIVGVSIDGVITSVNPAAARLAGRTAADMVGRTLAEVLAPAVSATLVDRLNSVIDGSDPGVLEGPLWIRGGRRLWVRAAIAIQRAATGEITGVVGVGLDATREYRLARKAMHQEIMLARMSERAVEAVGQERRAIAMGLHDELGQTLAALKLHVAMAMYAPEGERDDEHPRKAMELVDRAIAQTRTFTFELYPPILKELGLGAAIEWLADRLQSQSGGQWTFIGSDVDLSEDRAAVLYGVAQELMRNVVRHANATDVLITLATHDGKVSIAVYDNGTGFDQRARHEGLGLFGISVQLSRLGGELEIDTMPGGTTVRATIPIVAQRERERGAR